VSANFVKDFRFTPISAWEFLRDEKDDGSVLLTLINNRILEGKIVPVEKNCKLFK
jgi:hypothetical protein